MFVNKRIVFILLISFILVGCSSSSEYKFDEDSKVLTCESSAETAGIEVDVEMDMEFDENGENLKTIVINYLSTSSTVDVTSLNLMCDSFKDEAGITCELFKNNNNVNVQIIYDINKVSSELLNTQGFIYETYAEYFRTMSSGGFSCKEK